MTDQVLEAIIRIRDEISGPLNEIRDRIRDLRGGSDDLNNSMSVVGMGLQQAGQQMQEYGQHILDVVGNLSELAIASETSFSKVNSILGLGDKEFQNYKKDLKAGANELGMVYADYADSAYNAISAGVSKENVTSFLSQANQLAEGGLTELEGATDLLTTIQNAYGMTQKDMAHVSDVLIQTQNKGKEFCSVAWKQAA